MLPLEGMTVLDFSQAYNGPYGTMILADMGARVIKVERPGGEQSRYWFPYAQNGESAYYAVYNRNKEGIAVDLRSEAGKEIIKKLFAKVDVVVENFKVGTMDKLGLGYETAKAINPEIIFASSSGYGQDGPLAKNTAYDNVIESMCGYMDMSGFPYLPPLRSGASVGDSYTGITMALGVVLSYYHKKKTGKGTRVDVSMLDTMFASLEDSILTYGLTGKPLRRSGNAKPQEIVPYDTYRCKDGLIAVTILDESMWPDFCHAIEMPELIEDPLYATNDLRCENYHQFTVMINELFAMKKMSWLLQKFHEYQIPAAQVESPAQAHDNEQIKARAMAIEYEDPNVGKLTTFGMPVKFSKTPERIRKPSPLLGEDTAEIMKAVGYTQKEVAQYQEEGIIEIHRKGE